ncbi:MAG: beta-lactamase family protein [Anaerolineales bacterium]|nr:beta-lactamase family protein [Anaerolineales bacterium]
MKISKYIFPAILGCTALALLSQAFNRPASAAAVPANSNFEEIDTYLEEQIRRYNIPGAALAVINNGMIVHQRGFGQARPAGEVPTPQTPFMIGSLSKSFTALAVMQLVEDGKIELDDPVQKYLPWFRVADPQVSSLITVRHLLNQTSGLPAWVGEIQLADFDSITDAVEHQVRILSTVKPERPAGSAFEYNNANYNLLGQIVEVASGETYADYIFTHIFKPLGMGHSYTSKAVAQQDNMAVGHQYWFTMPVAVPDMPQSVLSLPTGQLISSTEDMSQYLITLLNGGRCGDKQILSESGVAGLFTGVAESTQMGLSFGYYGMGWFVDEINDTTLLWHSGTTPDFGSFMALLPEQKKGFILMFNANQHWMTPVFSDMGGGVAALLAGIEPTPTQFVGTIPWILRGQLLIPLLQIFGFLATVRVLQHWNLDPESRPGKARLWGRHILLPLIPNLLIASSLIPVLGKTHNYLMVYMADLSWTVLICGTFAGIWSIVRTGLMLKINRQIAAD